MSASVKHWQDPANLVLGLWMAISPWALSYAAERTPTMNAVIVGLLIALLALSEFFKNMAWEEWGNFALGVWFVMSPWVLGFAKTAMAAATWNAVAVGVVVAAFALWALGTDRSIGGWWRHAA